MKKIIGRKHPFAVLCPGGLGIVLVAEGLQVIGEAMMVSRGEPVYWFFLVGHALIMSLMMFKLFAVIRGYRRWARMEHIHHV